MYSLVQSRNEVKISGSTYKVRRIKVYEEIELKKRPFHDGLLEISDVDIDIKALRHETGSPNGDGGTTLTLTGRHILQTTRTTTSSIYIDQKSNGHIALDDKVMNSLSKSLLSGYQSRIVSPRSPIAAPNQKVQIVQVDRSTDHYTPLVSVWFDVDLTRVADLRDIILRNALKVSRDFIFVYNNNSSINCWLALDQEQERRINAKDILVTDKLSQDCSIFVEDAIVLTRVGIFECTGNGICLGSIFCNLNSQLPELRCVIDEHFKQLTGILDGGSGLYSRLKNFIFLDENLWPITPQQEAQIKAEYIINKANTIAIKSGSLADSMMITEGVDRLLGHRHESSPIVNSFQTRSIPDTKQTILGSERTLKAKRNWKFKDIFSKDATLLPVEAKTHPDLEYAHDGIQSNYKFADGSRMVKSQAALTQAKERKCKSGDRNRSECDNKLVMLSYVRRESAHHAISLKRALEEIGVSVYLDVHEIKSGSDWQDSLNQAVRSSSVFVPLVTSSYGKTLWSNREIKLADILSKPIIPVNFGQPWPPACLAIQFATTQYICWLSKEDEIASDIGEGEANWATDWTQPLDWPKDCVRNVASLIKKNIVDLSIYSDTGENSGEFTSKGISSMVTNLVAGNKNDRPQVVKTSRLIVISHHDKDECVVGRIKATLEANDYQVWLANASSSNSKHQNSTNKANMHGYIGSIPSDSGLMIDDSVDDAISNKQKYNSWTYYDDPQKSLQSSWSCSTLNTLKRPSQIYEQLLSKITEASLVILVGSIDYFKSSMSMIHVFYCESRKPMILVRVGDHHGLPQYFQMLLRDIVTIDIDSMSDRNLIGLIDSTIESRPNNTIDTMIMDGDEKRLTRLISRLKDIIPPTSRCLFVADGLNQEDLYDDPQMQQVCINLGMELAKTTDLVIVTNERVSGPASLIARTFVSCRQRDSTQCSREVMPCVYRILASNRNNLAKNRSLGLKEEARIDSSSSSDKYTTPATDEANQDFSGETGNFILDCCLDMSNDERCSILARQFDICLIVGWQPNLEVQKFVWSDHFIIPVLAHTKKIPVANPNESIFHSDICPLYEMPPSISEYDWDIITRSGYHKPIELSQTICKIITRLKQLSSITKKFEESTSGSPPSPQVFVSPLASRSDISTTSVNASLDDETTRSNQRPHNKNKLWKRIVLPFSNSSGLSSQRKDRRIKRQDTKQKHLSSIHHIDTNQIASDSTCSIGTSQSSTPTSPGYDEAITCESLFVQQRIRRIDRTN